MKSSLFEYPSFQYEVKDWDFKKKSILSKIKRQEFIRTGLQTFETDRQTNNKSYVTWLSNLLHEELSLFCQERKSLVV